MDKMVCTTFEIIQEICVTVKLNRSTNQWDLVPYAYQSGYATCYYPFNSWGFYLPLIYEDYYNASAVSANSSLTIQPKLRVMVRSVEDPFVIGESLFRRQVIYGLLRQQVDWRPRSVDYGVIGLRNFDPAGHFVFTFATIHVDSTSI